MYWKQGCIDWFKNVVFEVFKFRCLRLVYDFWLYCQIWVNFGDFFFCENIYLFVNLLNFMRRFIASNVELSVF